MKDLSQRLQCFGQRVLHAKHRLKPCAFVTTTVAIWVFALLSVQFAQNANTDYI